MLLGCTEQNISSPSPTLAAGHVIKMIELTQGNDMRFDLAKLKGYYEQKGIIIYKMSPYIDPEKKMRTLCESLDCPSGMRLLLEINEADADKLNDKGEIISLIPTPSPYPSPSPKADIDGIPPLPPDDDAPKVLTAPTGTTKSN